MTNAYSKFVNNRREIEERVLGAVIQYFVFSHTGDGFVTAESLVSTVGAVEKAENLMAFYMDTLMKVAMYFSTASTSSKFSDFQCNLAVGIYRDYVK